MAAGLISVPHTDPHFASHRYPPKQAGSNIFPNVQSAPGIPLSPAAHSENTRCYYTSDPCRKEGDSGCLSKYQNFLSCSHICNPNTWKAEAGGLPQVWSQPWLYTESRTTKATKRDPVTKKETFFKQKNPPIFLSGRVRDGYCGSSLLSVAQVPSTVLKLWCEALLPGSRSLTFPVHGRGLDGTESSQLVHSFPLSAELLRADTHRHSKLSTADCSGCARPGSFCNSRLEAF